MELYRPVSMEATAQLIPVEKLPTRLGPYPIGGEWHASTGDTNPYSAILFPVYPPTREQQPVRPHEINFAPVAKQFLKTSHTTLSYTTTHHELADGRFRVHHEPVPADTSAAAIVSARWHPDEIPAREVEKIRNEFNFLRYRDLPTPLDPKDSAGYLGKALAKEVIDFVLPENAAEEQLTKLLATINHVFHAPTQQQSREEAIEQIKHAVFDSTDPTANEMIRDSLLLARGVDTITGSRRTQKRKETPETQQTNQGYDALVVRQPFHGKQEIHVLIRPHIATPVAHPHAVAHAA